MEVLYSKVSILVFLAVIISSLLFFLDFQESFFSNLSFKRTGEKVCDIFNSINEGQEIKIEIENMNSIELNSQEVFFTFNEKEFSCKINSESENKIIQNPSLLIISKKKGVLYVQ